jgi:thymidylate kinase
MGSCVRLIYTSGQLSFFLSMHIEMVRYAMFLFRDHIRALISGGTHVIADRYVFSGIAFSAAKVG